MENGGVGIIPIRSFEIPVPAEMGGEPIVFTSDDLPDNVDGLLTVLSKAEAPLHVWHDIMLEYYRQGKPDAYEQILRKLLQESMFRYCTMVTPCKRRCGRSST